MLGRHSDVLDAPGRALPRPAPLGQTRRAPALASAGGALVRATGANVRCLLGVPCARGPNSEQLALAQRLPHPTPAPRLCSVELPERLACLVLALSGGSEVVVRMVELRTQLRDRCAQEFELGAFLVAQFDTPIPRLTSLSHRPLFAVRRPAPARRAPAPLRVRPFGGTRRTTRNRSAHREGHQWPPHLAHVEGGVRRLAR
jgi:hypothetical protein